MSVYNEEDIINEVIDKLISNGVEIYILDNGCTDSTINRIQHLVGKGIIDIINYITIENGKRVFKLQNILNKFELLAQKINYDWYMISDADEIKYAPWKNLSLNEGIEKVDNMGFNLINFKLFNFIPAESPAKIGNVEQDLKYFTPPDTKSAIQLKCWKKSAHFDIKSYGGHIVQVNNPRVFPIKFINKHYPIRSKAHGVRKIISERISRYSPTEINQGWHSHYNDFEKDFYEKYSKPNNSKYFDYDAERDIILDEAFDLLIGEAYYASNRSVKTVKTDFMEFMQATNTYDAENAEIIFSTAEKIYNISKNYYLPPIEASGKDSHWIRTVINRLKLVDYTKGNMLSSRNLDHINFIKNNDE